MTTTQKNAFNYLLLFGALFLASCGATNFKGYYPENHITGKGIGSGQAPAHTVETAQAENIQTLEAPATEVALEQAELTVAEQVPVVSAEQEKANKMAMRKLKQQTRAMKFAQVLMPNLSSMTNVDAINGFEKDGRKLNFIEKMAVKSYGRFMEKNLTKMGYDAARMPIEDIFAIVSLSAGGAAWITFYGVFLFGVAAVVFGILALVRGTSRRGMAIAGIVLGAVAYLLWIPLIFFVIYV